MLFANTVVQYSAAWWRLSEESQGLQHYEPCRLSIEISWLLSIAAALMGMHLVWVRIIVIASYTVKLATPNQNDQDSQHLILIICRACGTQNVIVWRLCIGEARIPRENHDI